MSMSADRQPLICLRGISKTYETAEVETHALSAVDLEIHAGEYLSISGPSGCGKSTLLSIIGLLDEPSAGDYWINGQPIANLSFSKRAALRNAHIGFIFQSFNLISDLTVAENVELPLRFGGVPSRERGQRVKRALERVSMDHRLKHFPHQLSGGQQQRVAVARALVTEPTLLLADEPTGNLDSSNGEQVMRLLTELHKAGATLCTVTHDARFAGLASRTIRMFDGHVVPADAAPARMQAVRS